MSCIQTAFQQLIKQKNTKKISVERADHIICILDNTRNNLIRFLAVAQDKICVVYLGFTLAHNNQAKRPKRKQTFLLYVGSRGSYKNFEELLYVYVSRFQLLKLVRSHV